MARARTAFMVVSSIVFLGSVYHHLFREELLITAEDLRAPLVPLYTQTNANYAIIEDEAQEVTNQISRHVTSVGNSIATVSILLPAWEVLVIVSPETPQPPESVGGHCTCLFPNGDTSPARPAGFLSSPFRMMFKCDLPAKIRRRLPFHQPILTRSLEIPPEKRPPALELLRWTFLVYDSITTENDVVLFAKGLNHRQGGGRSPNDLACVFGDGVRTAVTTSFQEVFRCKLPEPTAVSLHALERIKISLEVSQNKRVVPSVAYYTPARKMSPQQPKSLICACTMVYNAAKFLKEWVMYHSDIGVEKFFLYDNESDDDLPIIVEELIQEGYNMSTIFWIWPKTQEAGFSHCAIHANDSCTWMMYIDIDEFVYSPSWLKFSNPSPKMLNSLLPKSPSSIGQVMISCYEFGPSNQKSHPLTGVIQGYNCRRRDENRHKSIVLLEGIDDSLLNVIHHFRLKQGMRTKKLGKQEAVVNHYKFQAWSEFKTKFRRRVSAYVVDWTKPVNPGSKDRTPGLGFAPVEPPGWPEKFCELSDDRLKDLTRRWFGFESPSGYHFAWQS
ncbi:glycosyltransferase family 92 protein At1g27200-like [Actinidia eriantha]|uniref:glycosyltransferase family 92 protein At1g27200-like n=1 Tax=Actinidia eriantha TaxID=165200 RepID=UPI00258752A0|nr:glycosyltransferase family 92 protein At1g27200-like [Actinidia eriantha]